MVRLLLAMLGGTAEWAVVRAAAQLMRAVSIQIALAFWAVFLALGASMSAAAALWMWARVPLGSAGAALLVAAVYAVACGLVVLVMALLWRNRDVVSSRRAARVQDDPALLPVRLVGAAAHAFLLGLNGQTVPRR